MEFEAIAELHQHLDSVDFASNFNQK